MRYLCITTLVVLVVLPLAFAEGPAKCKQVPAPFARDMLDAEKKFTFEGAEVVFGYSNRLNAPYQDVGENAWLRILPGHGFPIHKHGSGASEFMYVLNGTGLHEVMAPGMTAPESQAMTAGIMNFSPPGGIHKLTNTGTEPLDLIVITSKTFSPFIVYEDWPASTEAEGFEVPAMPWEGHCPEGQELIKDEL